MVRSVTATWCALARRRRLTLRRRIVVRSGWLSSAGQSVQGWAAMGGNAGPVWQQLAGVFEDDDAVAEQAPALLGEGSHYLGRIMINGVGRRARGLVLAHCFHFSAIFG